MPIHFSGNGLFTSLTDSPDDYSGFANYLIRVKSTQDGVEYVAPNAISGALAIETITGATTLDSSDYTMLCDASSAAFTVTLPAAASNSGQVYNIKKIDSSTNAITVDGNSSETIDGDTTISITTQYESVTIQCDGSNWYII